MLGVTCRSEEDHTKKGALHPPPMPQEVGLRPGQDLVVVTLPRGARHIDSPLIPLQPSKPVDQLILDPLPPSPRLKQIRRPLVAPPQELLPGFSYTVCVVLRAPPGCYLP